MCSNQNFTKIVEETADMFTGSDTDCCIVARSIDGEGEIAMAGGDMGILYCIHTMLKQFATFHNGSVEDVLDCIRDIEDGAYPFKTDTKTVVFAIPK